MLHNTNNGPQAIPGPLVRWLILLCCVLLGLVSEASGGAMGLALRPAARDLHSNQAAIQLAALISKMFFGAFMLAGGVIGDIYGRRRVFILGVVVFVAASAVCAAAPTIHQLLVAARFLQGIWRGSADTGQPGDHRRGLSSR